MSSFLQPLAINKTNPVPPPTLTLFPICHHQIKRVHSMSPCSVKNPSLLSSYGACNPLSVSHFIKQWFSPSWSCPLFITSITNIIAHPLNLQLNLTDGWAWSLSTISTLECCISSCDIISIPIFFLVCLSHPILDSAFWIIIPF